MASDTSGDSGWQLPNAIIRAKLSGQDHAGISWLNVARSAVEEACWSGVRLVEVERAPDVLLAAGSVDWAESFVRQSRGVGDPTPVVVINVTAGNGSNARILDAGADDCLACPFDPGELLARLRAVLRRNGSAFALGRSSDVSADHATLRIRVRDIETRVSNKQFEIFAYLAQHRERWVHSSEIIAAVSGTHHDPTTSLLRVHIYALRKALGAERACIRCDGRRSYMLTLAPPSEGRGVEAASRQTLK